MPGELEFSLLGTAELKKRFDRLPALIKVRVARDGLTAAALLVQRRVKENVTGRLLNVRSGRLRSSITHRIVEQGNDIEARVGTDVLYAKIHEFGGTIRPKRSKHLTVPLGPALTPSGVPRYTAHALIDNPGIGGFERTFFRGKALFGVPSGGKPVAVFALVRMVQIREKRYMRTSLAESQRPMLQDFTRRLHAAVEDR